MAPAKHLNSDSTTPFQNQDLRTALQDRDVYIHSYLHQSHDPKKGRQLLVSASVKKGTVLIADAPYALVPIREPPKEDDDDSSWSDEAVLCSNVLCRRRVPRIIAGGEQVRVHCPNNCLEDVVWCNTDCRTIDKKRHAIECPWLKKYSAEIRRVHGEEDFTLLWLTMRLLAARYLETYPPSKWGSTDNERQGEGAEGLPWETRFKRGWESIECMRSNRGRWTETRIRHWEGLLKKYLSDPEQPGLLSAEEILTLICKKETNTFGLYEFSTGPGLDGMNPRARLYIRQWMLSEGDDGESFLFAECMYPPFPSLPPFCTLTDRNINENRSTTPPTKTGGWC